MHFSYLAATTLVLGLTALSTTASASCGGMSCNTYSGSSSGYSHTSTGNLANNYGGHSTYSHGSPYGGTTHTRTTANCPAGTSPSSDGSCLINGNGNGYFGNTTSHGARYGSSHGTRHSSGHSSGHSSNHRTVHGTSHGSTYGGSYMGSLRSYRSTTGSARAPLGSYAGQTQWTTRHMTGAEATHRYGTGTVSKSYTDGNHTIIPFSTRATNMSTHRIKGMGTNEVLTPTQCPVSVYNPNGGKVLGCYSVGTVAPRTRTVTRTVVRRIIPHTVRVIRPIIYVRYPVPVPVPFPVYQPRPYMGHGYTTGYSGGCAAGYSTRYGQHWPGRPCGY